MAKIGAERKGTAHSAICRTRLEEAMLRHPASKERLERTREEVFEKIAEEMERADHEMAPEPGVASSSGLPRGS